MVASRVMKTMIPIHLPKLEAAGVTSACKEDSALILYIFLRRWSPTTIPSRRCPYVLHKVLTDFMTQDLYFDLVCLAVAIVRVIAIREQILV